MCLIEKIIISQVGITYLFGKSTKQLYFNQSIIMSAVSEKFGCFSLTFWSVLAAFSRLATSLLSGWVGYNNYKITGVLLELPDMFQSALHPFSHTPALSMCVLMAFTTASIPPAISAFTLFSSVQFIYLFVLIQCFYHWLSCSWVHHTYIHTHQHCSCIRWSSIDDVWQMHDSLRSHVPQTQPTQ